METVLYIFAKAVQILLEVMSFAMLLRVILQFFVDTEENKLYTLCFYISEIGVYPFRLLFAKFHIAENTPLDVPFLVGCVFISMLPTFLPII